MIKVYYRDARGNVSDCIAEFYDVTKAMKFMYSIKDKDSLFLEGWSCEDPYENEWLYRRISISKINGGKIL